MKYFILAVKVLIPFAFFACANTSNVLASNAVAGVATIVVIANYLFEYIETQKP